LLHAVKPAATITPAINPDVWKSFMASIPLHFRSLGNATIRPAIRRSSRRQFSSPQFPFPLFPRFVLFVLPASAA
jgi:hypothetical protein